MLFVLPRQVTKACERPPSAQEARPAGQNLYSSVSSCRGCLAVARILSASSAGTTS